jgi:hypothetical protein
MRNTAAFDYPNKHGMILQLAMEEILGNDGVEAVVRCAAVARPVDGLPGRNPGSRLPFFNARALQWTLESMHGTQAGRGIALQIGRACFKYCLRALGSEHGLTNPDLHLLPLPARLLKGNEAFAGLFRSFTDQNVRLEQQNGSLLWILDSRPAASGGAVDGPVSMLAVGLLQEAFCWLSAGRTIQVEEKCGLAGGGTVCTIVIDKNPKN